LIHEVRQEAKPSGDENMRKPGQTASKLKVTIKLWKEILNKEMAYSADLRNQQRATDAFSMVLKLEAELFEIEAA
jgi:hypothetical protein